MKSYLSSFGLFRRCRQLLNKIVHSSLYLLYFLFNTVNANLKSVYASCILISSEK